ncbi:DUF2523 domain-containing protein [Photobacterium sp. WH24]|uniref:DUF2523 family protein n=1 Tax=Photobacterium sp. WH24 TaxID=2827237 RepID=UPI001C448372|nr:DUF2523 family protein [Photobacterium sp. WH24]MBV7262333.1 DUF2523 domain-containing protein [Photobacterium sp. WH24]
MLNWLSERWNDFLNLCLSVLFSIWDMVIDLVCFVFETIFNLVVSIVDGLGGMFSSFGLLQYLNILPDDMVNVMALIGINEASAIIVSAVIVRFLLQLIPFVRLGS